MTDLRLHVTSAELSSLLLLATAGSFTPGPNTTLSTALGANRGLRGALHFVCAVPIGWGALLSVCAAGLGGLVMAVPALRVALLAGGLAYLVWLASVLWRSNRLRDIDDRQLDVTFWQGVSLQFLNIKAWMLALAIVSGWIAGHDDAWQRTLTVLPLMIAFGLVSNLVYAALGALLRQWLQGPMEAGRPTGRRLVVFNRIMALALLLTALWMGYSALLSAPPVTGGVA